MLPILRIIPVGGVCLAVLILLLAISPPRQTREGAAPDMVLARGALIDRRQHPEWPQFLVQAAFRRADEILTLRDLPDTPTRVAPVALPPQRPVIAALPVPQARSAPDDAVVTAPQAVPAEPAERQTEQNTASAPAPPSSASESPVTRTAALPLDVDAVKPEPSAAPQPQTPPAPAPADSAKPESPMPAPAAATRLAAPPAKPETATKVAVLPIERPATDPDPDDVTGSVDTVSGSTIPVDIGETSSTELPIVLPRERPPILSTRERSSRAVNHKRPMRHARAAAKPGIKRAAASNVQPASEVNLFESLFGSAATTGPSTSARGKGGNATKSASTVVDVPRYPPTVFYPFTSK